MIIYITYLVDISLQYIDFIHSQKTVVNTICDYIDEHYHENIPRDNIAKIVYLSPDYITRIFKKEKGLSLVNYIIKKRVDIAKELLIQTTLPVHIISDKVGYGNYSYFTKLLKKETNYTPFEYRRKEKSSAL
ncbi:helix-turn-helix domain-containing protein [Niallia circulans]|uniref:helix-turn-helix domain-containing protein n=1 Tax=Niallia circulans TaxID=1397 RepID=UPI00352F60FA